MFSSDRRWILISLVVAGAIGAIAAWRVNANAPETVSAGPPAAAVDVRRVEARRISDWHAYTGRLEPVERVAIRPQVTGTITKVHFRDGDLVEKGQVLFSIDPRPWQAAVDQAKGRFDGARARASYTASDFARAKRLLAANAIARNDYEEKRNASMEASANLQAADAMLDAAMLDLEHTRIVAPISGRISRAEVTEGNVVQPGTAFGPLTTLVSVSPIYASFDVDEQSFLKFVSPARSGGLGNIRVYLGLANEEGYGREGTLASVDNRLDSTSGTIRVRAVFDNPDGALVPGLFARIRMGGTAPRDAVLVDEKAVGTDQDKRFVLVVDDTNKTAYREVSLGAAQDGLRIVEHGLRDGERIVVNGLQHIRPGDQVAG